MSTPLLDILQDISRSLSRIADTLAGPSPAPMGEDTPPAGDKAPSLSRVYRDPVEEPAVSTFDEVDAPARVRAFLAARGVQIKTERPALDRDAVLERLAVFLGSRYRHLEPFFKQVKAHMNAGTGFTMGLRGQSQVAVSSTCQWASELHSLALLEAYRYQNSPKYLIYAMPSRDPRALNFFSGDWLERYVLFTVRQVVARAGGGVRFSWLANPQVILPNGDDFELDLIFSLNGVVFWIEAKSGEYQRHVKKYSEIARLLQLPPSRMMMVLTETDAARAKELSHIFGMTVIPVEDLSARLTEALVVAEE